MNYLKNYTLVCMSIVLINSFHPSFAQDLSENNLKFSIESTGQYPNTKQIKDKRGLAGRFVDLILGKEQYILSKPIAVYAKSLDTLWILDQTNGVVLKVQNNVGEMPRVMRNKIRVFPSLIDFCSLPNDQLIFSDSQLNKLFKVSEDGIFEFTKDSLLNQPTGIAYSKHTNSIWVLETASHCISVLDEDGNLLKKIGKRGSGPSEFNYPTSICIDNNGIIYILDAMNFRVQIFSKDGQFLSSFGELGDATGYFSRPKGIATDSYGHIYVTDALFHTVQIFDKKGNFLNQFGRQGHNEEEFWMPSGIFIDKEDNIFVADSYNSRIQMFKLQENE